MPLPQWRLELSGRLQKLGRLVESLDLRHAQIRGSLYRQRIRCGHPGCHCASGPGHLRWCLAFASSKGRHTRSLSPEELRELAPAAEAYRRYRKIRAEAARCVREIFEGIDRIQKALERSGRRK